MEEVKNLGEEYKSKRISKGLSQAKLAKLTGIKQSRVSAWELGKDGLDKVEVKILTRFLDEIDESKIEKLKKKKITRKLTHQVVIPKRSYRSSQKNQDYINQLKELENNFSKPNKKLKAMSFFAGCGGLCYGVKAAGFEVVATNELVDEYKAINALNFPAAKFLTNDVCSISNKEIQDVLKKHPNIDLMVGGPPCQGFSLAGKRDVNDSRNTLFENYLRIAEKVNPRVILIENVKLLTSMKDPNGKYVKDRIKETFSKMGYKSSFFIVNAKNYGVAQHRERVIFIGVRSDIKSYPSIPDPICGEKSDLLNQVDEVFNMGDAISDLEYLESGQRSKIDEHHWAVKHPNHVLNWLVNVPQGKSAHDNIDPELRPPSGYNTTYKRQEWDKPAGTVATTFGMISGCRNVHPIATRSMTVREALRLQSFPDSFKLCGNSGNIRTVIGNAVPPLLGYHLAKHIVTNYM